MAVLTPFPLAVQTSGVVDVCLIPEVAFALDKLTAHVKSILKEKGHCVVCVAEGAGQVGGLRTTVCLAVALPGVAVAQLL